MTKRKHPGQVTLDQAQLQTLAVRAGQVRSAEGEHSEAIYSTSSYVFDSAEHAARRFSGEEDGNVYSRYTNPTVRIFEQRMAALEGAEAAVATSSGMASLLSTLMALLSSGDHLVCSRDVFGTTTSMLSRYFSKFGVTTSFVDLCDVEQWQAAIGPKTRMLLLETPSNPLGQVADMAQLADLAHANNALLVVDNTFCTPILQRPFEYGADIVWHSATKYIDGQGRCVGGVVLGSAELMEEVTVFLRTAGPTMSALNAWVFLKGLETLRLRMYAHSESAMTIAQWLQVQTGIEQVFYNGLEDSPHHELASRQQLAYGGVVSFRVRGGREQAWQFIDATEMMSLTANLGDAKTTIVHPATTTHGRLPEEDRVKAGITENLVRVCIGLEDVVDIKRDLLRGIAALG